MRHLPKSKVYQIIIIKKFTKYNIDFQFFNFNFLIIGNKTIYKFGFFNKNHLTCNY